MSLTPAFLDELRSRTLLSGLIGKSVKLQKAGREFKGCCPFHNEKTPSFYVNDDKGFYHCFGCSAHGDAIRWLTDQRGLPFIDAVKELAQAAGMEMPAQDRQAVERAERAKGHNEAMADAAAFFTEQLNGITGAEARAVLEKRGVTAQTAQAFGLGYSPDARGRLRERLRSYGDQLLTEVGLLIKVDDKEPYDRFRGRLMIPIRDARGRVIAFGGRVIGDGEPKYLNSPETPLFDKGRTLYNLDRAAPASRKSGRVIVVEGYMDVIALAQAGFEEAVAPLGTALTEPQLERLWRLTENPILCFDGDIAGQKAAIRAAHRALPFLNGERTIQFVALPVGQDPDDVIRQGGAEAFNFFLQQAIPIEEQIWRSEFAGMLDHGPQQRTALRNRLARFAAQIGDRVGQKEYGRAFENKFFKVFGWNGKNVEAIRDAMAEAHRRPRRGLTYALQRATLLGLMMYPQVIGETMEDLHKFPLSDQYLEDWREHLIQAKIDQPDINESMVNQILSESNVSPIEERNLRTDLAFSFYSKIAEPCVAMRDLRKVIETLVDEHITKMAFEIAQRQAEAELSEQSFQEQQRRRQDLTDAETRLKYWLEQIDEAA